MIDDDSKVVQKDWGGELIFANNEKYCGKLLTVYHGKWSSGGRWHYHPIKDETFFVIEGCIRLDILSEDGELQKIILPKGQSHRVRPGIRHRFTSLEKVSRFIEASSTDDPSDSIREEPNVKHKIG